MQLYQVPSGFFVELNYDVDKNEVTHLFSFEACSDDDRLEDYAMFVKLPETGWEGSCEPDSRAAVAR